MSGLRVADMSDSERPDFLRTQHAAYVDQRVEFGGEDVADATRTADRQYGEFFPDGKPGPGHFLFTARNADTDERIGILWLSERDSGASVWIYDIEVDAAARGHGWGRQLMRFAETWAKDRGAAKIELNVFGGNVIARTLYRSLGYVENSVHMGKTLTG